MAEGKRDEVSIIPLKEAESSLRPMTQQTDLCLQNPSQIHREREAESNAKRSSKEHKHGCRDLSSNDLQQETCNLNQAERTNITNLGPAPLQKCVGDLCCINFGGFCRGFSWRIFSEQFFPPKMRRKHPATKSAKKSGGLKIEIRAKSVLPKSDPNKLKSQRLSLANVKSPALQKGLGLSWINVP